MKQRLLAFLLGTAAVLLLAEGGLRVTGLALGARAPRHSRSGSGGTILCLGDSFTVGASAPERQSYPAQLEHILNRNGSGLTFTVINDGRLGQNTAQLLDELERELDETSPSLVVLLTGGANAWNFYGYHSYLEEGWPARLADRLDTIKLVKLARLLKAAGAASEDPLPRLTGKAGGTPQCLPPASAPRIAALYREAELALGKGDRAAAIERLKEAVLLDPGNGYTAWDIASIYEAAGDGRQAGAWKEKAALAPEVCPLQGHKINLRNETDMQQALRGWIARDIARIIAVCDRKGVPVILQNYPLLKRDLWSYKPDIYAAAAARNSVRLVDNDSVFIKLGAEGRSLFSSDPFGHCNAEGYGVMAGNVADAIIRSRIFRLPPPPQNKNKENPGDTDGRR